MNFGVIGQAHNAEEQVQPRIEELRRAKPPSPPSDDPGSDA